MKPDAHPKDSRLAGKAGVPQDHAEDDDEDDDVYGDPSTVKNEGPLESFGKAVSAPIRDAARDSKATDPKPKAP